MMKTSVFNLKHGPMHSMMKTSVFNLKHGPKKRDLAYSEFQNRLSDLRGK
jgi:hypothetical protein